MRFLKVGDKKQIGALIIIIILTEAAGYLAGFLGMPSQNVYTSLIKPSFAPPGWVFPIVWAVLYLLMATSFYRIWISKKSNKGAGNAIIYYCIQLFLNLIWPIIFFRFRLYGLAFIEMILLLIFILVTTFKFFKVDKVTVFLMIPYIIWVFFAAVLNYAIWMFNEM